MKLSYFLWDFDAIVEKSIYPRIETGYGFTSDMIIELVDNFLNQNLHKAALF